MREKSGERRYSEAERHAILQSLRLKPDVDQSVLLATIASEAEFYVDWVRGDRAHLTKLSDSARQLEKFKRVLAKLSAGVVASTGPIERNRARRTERTRKSAQERLKAIKANRDTYEALRSAAEELADCEISLPDFGADWALVDGEGQPPVVVPVWPVEAQIDRALATAAVSIGYDVSQRLLRAAFAAI
jgi:hypothetical protein